ncbi:DUF1847 domain-containing protein [Chloroflexota bacterium]
MASDSAQQREVLVDCAKCPAPVCYSAAWEQGPDNCPTKIRSEVIKKATEKCLSPEFREFAYLASKQEASGSMTLPHAPTSPSPIKSRLEETMEFAKRMGYKKLGVAFCAGVRFEAGILIPILENRGFEVVSVCCKCGSVPKEALGLEAWEKIVPGSFESMCHPIAQAEILNSYDTDFNIMVCLCVGHDSLFLKNSKAMCTVLAAKDRVFGHAPLLAIYQSKSYHRRVLAKDTDPDANKKA